jgi:hypothetical protein
MTRKSALTATPLITDKVDDADTSGISRVQSSVLPGLSLVRESGSQPPPFAAKV